MRTEDGIFCDIIDKGRTGRCGKPSSYIHSCQVENTEFAMCSGHQLEFKALILGKQELAIRCPRCIPGYIANSTRSITNIRGTLPPPITGVLARAFDDAMTREGILGPTRENVLRRLAAVEDTYIKAIFRSMADPVTT